MCMYMFVYGQVHMCVCVYGLQRSTSGASLISPFLHPSIFPLPPSLLLPLLLPLPPLLSLSASLIEPETH